RLRDRARQRARTARCALRRRGQRGFRADLRRPRHAYPGPAGRREASGCMSEALPATLRTLIVDDEPLAIERMQVLCAEIESLVVVGTASDGESALRLAEKLSPDLLLLDMTM